MEDLRFVDPSEVNVPWSAACGNGVSTRPRLTLGLSKDSYTKAFGLKDHAIYGFWAILILRVRIQGSSALLSEFEASSRALSFKNKR